MNDITISTNYLRVIIQGKVHFRKCPNCDNEGIERQAYNRNDEPCSLDDPDGVRQECENCDGLAYLEMPNDE